MKDKLYKIKQITWKKWDEFTYFPDNTGNIYINHRGNGSYSVNYCFKEYYDEDSIDCNSLEEAKEKAQEIFNKRALVFLEEINGKDDL